jgi:hypothetical protein
MVENYIDFGEYLIPYKKKFKIWDEGISKAIKPEDWYLFQRIVKEYNVKSVLEFGCGLSTFLWQAMGLRLTTCETNSTFMKRVLDLFNSHFQQSSKAYWINWNNKTFPNTISPADWSVDLAFIDGIDPRDKQIEVASLAAKRVIVHDGYTKPTPSFIEQYLENWIEIPVDSVRSRLFVKEV